jgi:hypothetical protein
MPSKLLYRIGLTQKGVYSFHMFMYGGPLLMFLQEPSFFLGDSALEFFERRVFNDYDFLLGLLMLVLLDTITGGFKAINSYKMFGESYLRDNQGKKVRQFSGRVFYEKMSKKLFGITVAVVCLGVLKNTKIAGEEGLIQELISSGFYSVILGFEGASVLKNSYGIYPWEPIKLILKKLDIFINQKTGKVE